MKLLAPAFALLIASSAACIDNPTVPTVEDTQFAPSLGVDLAASTRTEQGLYYRDLVAGTGNTADDGELVKVRYSLWLSNGTLVQEIPPTQAPFEFHVNAREVIEGWDVGIPGMKVGGRRQLIIPPWLGYGPSGYGQIPGNAVLVFTVDLVEAP